MSNLLRRQGQTVEAGSNVPGKRKVSTKMRALEGSQSRFGKLFLCLVILSLLIVIVWHRMLLIEARKLLLMSYLSDAVALTCWNIGEVDEAAEALRDSGRNVALYFARRRLTFNQVAFIFRPDRLMQFTDAETRILDTYSESESNLWDDIEMSLFERWPGLFLYTYRDGCRRKD